MVHLWKSPNFVKLWTLWPKDLNRTWWNWTPSYTYSRFEISILKKNACRNNRVIELKKTFGTNNNWAIYYNNIYLTFSLKSCFSIRDQIYLKTFVDQKKGPFSEIASPSNHSTKSYFRKIEAAVLRCSVKNMFWKFSESSQKTFVAESYFSKVAGF